MIKECADRHEVAIVVIHHVRKMQSEDIMNTVSGSNGINCAADGTWILARARGESDASLYMTGRDTEEQTFALRFDREVMRWTIRGDANEYGESKEGREILALFKDGRRMKPKEIAEALGRDPKTSTLRVILRKMVDAGTLAVDGAGSYGLPVNTINNVNTKPENVYVFTLFTGSHTELPAEEELEIC